MSSFRQTLLVKRRSVGAYDIAGFYKVQGSHTTVTITASIQPVSGSDLILLPENRREEELLKLYTETLLIGAEKGNPINCDIITINGFDYEVVKVFPWRNNVIPHYKVFVSKRTTNDSIPPIGV
jgi:hypothetical protein